MEYDIFISYSRKDTQIVDQFVDRLKQAGYSVWIDLEGIHSGEQFTKIIAKAIKNSAVVVFFSSANSNSSNWTVMEIGYALKKGKTIIPIRLDDSEYEDSIDFLLTLIDFIPYNPQQPSACIDRLITSLAAHGCNRLGSEAIKNSKTPSLLEMPPEELYSLGKNHYNNEEYEQAVKCFRKAAEQGLADAQCNLGICYEKAQGVKQDYQQAASCYQKAAEQGNAGAQYNLGFCYERGQGVQLDYQKATFWYQKAAEQGNTDAQCNLGFCYEHGQGVQLDYQKAIFWYLKAAEQGNAGAQCNLGFCYEHGQGVQLDYQQAISWYRKAAEQGYAGAQCNLGFCHEHGLGVQKDFMQATYWYQKAAEQGYENAFKALRQLKKKIMSM